MLRSLKELEHYSASGSDGEVGRVINFLFDDEQWTIRYLVVDTGTVLAHRKLLISPISFRSVDWSTQQFRLALTKEKLLNSPNIDADMSVSRQHERAHSIYYEYPYYWGFIGLWGEGIYPGLLAGAHKPQHAEVAPDVHLRSANEVRKYHVEGSDASVGNVEDFIIDDETWQIRYLVVDTSRFWFGKSVLVAAHWATRVDWLGKTVHVDLPRESVKASPEWDPSAPVNREYEARLYDYYGRPVYWEGTGERIAPRR